MKKIIALLLALLIAASFIACGKDDKADGSAGKPETGSVSTGKDEGKQDEGKSEDDLHMPEGQEYDDMMAGLNALVGEDDRLGKEYYKFPAVSTYSSLPDPSVWTEMGMIDLTPKDCENGKIYDDGSIVLDGTWNGFSIECDSSREAFEDLINRLWDAGYRGIPVGNGVIVEADSMDEVYDDFDDRYLAFYEHDGWLLCVDVSFYEWDNGIHAGVIDAKTMTNDYENLIVWPKLDWKVTRAGAPAGGLDSLGSDLHGNWGEYEVKEYNGSYTVDMYIAYASGVTAADFEAYVQKLSGRDDVYADAYGEEDGWETWFVYYNEPNPDGFGFLELSYCEKAGMVCWEWGE